ncbi:MAG: hypothetical protein IT371_30695 [Deltaproteobacteria bacterium]|nr:hypothetical protein [Deltaproteobacteria bacterium]
MPSPMLAQLGNTNPSRVLRYSGASPANVGAGTFACQALFNADGLMSYGAGCFRGDAGQGYHTFVVVGLAPSGAVGIWRTTDGGATYANVLTGGIGVWASRLTGPVPVYVNGTLYLTALIVENGFPFFYAYAYTSTTYGATWSGPFGGSVSALLNSVVVWRGGIWCAGNAASTSTFTPGTNTWATNAINGGNCQSIGLGVFNDRLLAVFSDSAGGNLRRVAEFTGGSWVNLATIASGVGPSGGFGMFMPDGNDLWVFWWHGTSQGWRAHKSAGSNLSSWTLDNTPVPLAIQSGVSSANTSLQPWADQELTPGVYPTRYVWYTPNASTAGSRTLYLWNGGGSAMTVDSTGGSVFDRTAGDMRSQGSSFQNTGERKIEMTARTPTSGGERWSFKLYSPNPSVDSVNVRFWVGTALDEFAITPVGLSNPSAGSISGNSITGLDAADNGTTTFQVTVNLQAAGFAPGQRRKLVAEVYT